MRACARLFYCDDFSFDGLRLKFPALRYVLYRAQRKI